MIDFDLWQNFTQNSESLLRRIRPHIIPPKCTLSASEQVSNAQSASNSMAQKTLLDFSAPSASNVPVGPDASTGGENFKIKMGLIMMVQASPFYGKGCEDACIHLQQFLELCSLLLSREFCKMLSGSDCFRFLL